MRSWGALGLRVQTAAASLQALGVAPGERVLVHGRNSPALFETMWACWMIGAVWVPTNFRLTPAEIAYLARSSGAVLHLFDRSFPDHAAAAHHAAVRAQLWLDEWDGLATGETALAHPVDVDRDDCCWFFYTSGTTGRPKAGMLTHGQMAFVVTNHLCDLMPGTTEQDASLVIAPLSHGAGVHSLSQVARGAVSILLAGESFSAEEAWSLVAKYRVTNMFTVPTIVNLLCRDAAVDRHDHASLRYVIYAGAPMYRADQVFALGKLGRVLVQYFGLGEVTGNITVLPPALHDTDDAKMKVGSCGYARTGIELAILDPAGNRMQPFATGEISCRGPAVFAGYFDNPDADAKAFAGGWFRTGDLGHLDAEGFLFITGRASDMYISGGSNVYPREVEEALLLHPAIAEACVLGLPDPQWGEIGVAVLVLHPEARVNLGEMLAHLEGRIAKYKFPRRIAVWTELPKSGYGKVVKRDVAALLGE